MDGWMRRKKEREEKGMRQERKKKRRRIRETSRIEEGWKGEAETRGISISFVGCKAPDASSSKTFASRLAD